MFRIGLKFPCNDLSRVYKVKKHGYSRLYLTARYYETQTRAKCDHNGRFRKDVILTPICNGSNFSTGSSHGGTSGGGKSFGKVLALGTMTLIPIGILFVAKSNSSVRSTLEDWVPGTNKVIQIIFQEETTYYEFVCSLFESLKQSILNMFMGETTEPTKSASKPVHGVLVDGKSIQRPTFANKQSSDGQSNKEKPKEPSAGKTEPPSPPSTTKVPTFTLPSSLTELEKECGLAATKAILAYQEATNDIHKYNENLYKIVEMAEVAIDHNLLQRLKDSGNEVNKILSEAEKFATDTLESVKQLYTQIDNSKFDAPSHVKLSVKRNVKKLLDDIDEAKKKYDDMAQNKHATEQFWKKVTTAQEHFSEELQILFPNFNIHDKNFATGEEGFDLFVLHMFNKVNYLQRELDKLQTFCEGKLKNALQSSDETISNEKLTALISIEVDKEKRILEEEFSKTLLAEQKKLDNELRRQLKLQSQVHADHLHEALGVQERETNRLANLAINEAAEAEHIKYKTQLAAIVGRLRGFEAALKARLEEEKGANEVQLLWSACQALSRAIKAAPPGTDKNSNMRPLESEIKAVCKAAPKNDPLVLTTLKSIPEEAVKRGVFPEDALRNRFLKVENMARKLALVPENGAALPVYLLSYLQSFLIVKSSHPIPKTELDDEPIDVDSFNTFDILHRARYWLDRGDFKMTLRYMNLLKGASRAVARDWMNETKILLETQQAIDTLLAYAGASGLLLLGRGDAKKSVDPGFIFYVDPSY